MAKFTRLVGLLLLTSSAALAQRPSAPARYLMLVRDLDNYESSATRRLTLTIIEPDGTFRTEESTIASPNSVGKKAATASITRFTPDSSSSFTRRQRYAQNTVYQAEVKKMNELSDQGWQLLSTTQEGPVVRYLFRKDTPGQ